MQQLRLGSCNLKPLASGSAWQPDAFAWQNHLKALIADLGQIPLKGTQEPRMSLLHRSSENAPRCLEGLKQGPCHPPESQAILTVQRMQETRPRLAGLLQLTKSCRSSVPQDSSSKKKTKKRQGTLACLQVAASSIRLCSKALLPLLLSAFVSPAGSRMGAGKS